VTVDNLNKALVELGKSQLLNKMNDLVQTAESTNLFPYAFEKAQLRNHKNKFFRENTLNNIIVVVNPTNYINVSDEVDGYQIKKMPEADLVELCENESLREQQLRASIVILTNNNLAKITPSIFSKLVSKCLNTLFVIHDFDNHHWHDMSFNCALLSDVYAPAHLADFSLVARITPTIKLGVPCGTIQWTKEFLIENLDRLISMPRKHGPLGKHTYYSKFKYRNSVLSTVNKHYPAVGFIESDFHSRNETDRWVEWANYPLHWIAPVNNDLPLRFFDSLITGGIPLIPLSLKPYIDFLKIPPEYYICYSQSDILDVEQFILSAMVEYKKQGKEGQLSRFSYALKNFHVDSIINKLINSCISEFSCISQK